MNIHNAINKDLSKLNNKQLKLLKQSTEEYLKNYKQVIKNYPKDRYEKCAVPHIKQYTDFLERIIKVLAKL